MKPSATLVFDIGKTAKKALVFDERFHVVEETVEHFSEIQDEDGFPSEDLAAVSTWVIRVLKQYMLHPEFTITHVNFSAYGASLVHLTAKGKIFPSFYNYLKPFPERCRETFLRDYGSDDLLARTASPWLGMLNSGLQLYWMKQERNDRFTRIGTSLHLPQYFSFLLTGKKFSDITSIGCHTLLWDFEKNDYHRWVFQEIISTLLAPVQLPRHRIAVDWNGQKLSVGVGIHDSSAALMPYLVSMKEPFILLSTGTWNIAFNPFNHEPLTPEELKRDCLCYLTFEGKPVKASRIFLGHEHELQVSALATHFHVDVDSFSKLAFNEALYTKLASEGSEKKIFSIGMEGTGPLPEKPAGKTSWNEFDSAEEAYHQLMRTLVRWQLLSLDLVDPGHRVKQLIVVGGFTRNQVFLQVLKREAKHLNVLMSDHPRAAALGAAWLVHDEEAYRGKEDLLKVYPLS